MYKIPSERCHKNTSTLRTSACVTSDSPPKLQFSKLTPKKFVESAHTEPRRLMNAIHFGIHLSFKMSSMLYNRSVEFGTAVARCLKRA